MFLSEAVSRDRRQAFSGWGGTGIFQPLFIALVLPSSPDQPAELHPRELLTVSAVGSLPISVRVPCTCRLASVCSKARGPGWGSYTSTPAVCRCISVYADLEFLQKHNDITADFKNK